MNEEQKRWAKAKSLLIPEEIKLGHTYSYLLVHRPRQLLFVYARYKFAARLIGEKPIVKILEFGCNEGIGTLLFTENGHTVTAVDFDMDAIKWAQKNLKEQKKITFKYGDFLGNIYGEHDAVVLLDVLEHIPKDKEAKLFKTITGNLNDDGYCIIGTPNIAAKKFSSKESKAGHVNLFSPERLRDTVRKYFKNAFLFGMNDEVMHTGFYPMSQYIFCLGCAKITK